MKKPVSTRINKIASSFAYSLIPAVVVIFFTLAFIPLSTYTSFFQTQLTTDLSQEYIAMNGDAQSTLVLGMSKELTEYLNSVEKVFSLVENYTRKTLLENKTSNVRSYYYGELTPTPEFSERYNTTVDFQRSVVKVYASGDENNWSKQIIHEINVTANLDLLLPTLFGLLEETISIQVGTPAGVLRTFPNYNFNATEDFRQKDWYLKAANSSDMIYSTAKVDNQLHSIYLTISKSLYFKDQLLAVVALNFEVKSIQSMLYSPAQASQNYQAVMDRNKHIVAHSNVDLNDFLWNSSYYSTLNMTQLYSPSASHEQYLNFSVQEFNQQIVNTDSSTIIITANVVKGFEFIILSVRELNKQVVQGSYELSDVLPVPFAVISILGIIGVIILRKYGFLKKITLEEVLEKLGQTPMSIEEASQLAADKIREKGMKIRTTISETLSFDEGLAFLSNPQQAIEEKISEKMDTAIELVDQKLETLFNPIEKLETFIGKIHGKSEDYSELASKIRDRKIDLNNLLRGDYSELSGLTKAEIVATIFQSQELLDLLLLSRLLNKEPEAIKAWIDILPDSIGVTTKGNNVIIDQSKLRKNLGRIVAEYNSGDFEVISQLLLIKEKAERIPSDLINEFLSSDTYDVSKYETIRNNRFVFLAALLLKSERIPLAALSSLLAISEETLSEIVERIPEEYGIKLDHSQTIVINPDTRDQTYIPLLYLLRNILE